MDEEDDDDDDNGRAEVYDEDDDEERNPARANAALDPYANLDSAFGGHSGPGTGQSNVRKTDDMLI